MLEVKGELVFKTVAYHRAADAIGAQPGRPRGGLPRRQAAADPGRRQGDQRQDRGARDDRPHGLLRPAPRRGPAEPRRAAADPRARPQDRPPAPRRARHRRRSTTCARRPRRAASATSAGMSARTEALVLEGIAKLDDRLRADAPRPGRGARSTALIDALSATPGRPLDRAGRLVPPPQGVDRRPRPPRRDRPSRPALIERVHRRSGSSIASSTAAATRPRSGCCAARRST